MRMTLFISITTAAPLVQCRERDVQYIERERIYLLRLLLCVRGDKGSVVCSVYTVIYINIRVVCVCACESV